MDSSNSIFIIFNKTILLLLLSFLSFFLSFFLFFFLFFFPFLSFPFLPFFFPSSLPSFLPFFLNSPTLTLIINTIFMSLTILCCVYVI